MDTSCSDCTPALVTQKSQEARLFPHRQLFQVKTREHRAQGVSGIIQLFSSLHRITINFLLINGAMSDLKRVCRQAWQRISRTYRLTTFEHLPPVLVFMLLMIMVA